MIGHKPNAPLRSDEEAKPGCQMQDRFLARAHKAIEKARRDGTGISPDELLRRMDERIDAVRNLLGESAVKPTRRCS